VTGAAGATVGVDIGGTKMLAVVVDPGGAVLADRKVPTPTDGRACIDGLAAVVAAVTGGTPVASLGVGVPGLVDASGALRSSAHLPGLVGLPIARELSLRLPGTPVWVGNDATCAGWAERTLGAAAGAADVVMVTLGTGIGGGIIAGGRLVEGAHRYAGEIGHTVIDPHGPPCPCGRRGCWERMASGSGLGRLGREWAIAGRAPTVVALAGGDPEAVRGEHVTTAAARGAPDAEALMAEFAWWLALGLANLANVLDPAVVVLGGGLIAAGDVLMDPARRAFAEMVEGHDKREGLVLVAAALGERAGAVGAALIGAGPPAPPR
jgi:glucokinase